MTAYRRHQRQGALPNPFRTYSNHVYPKTMKDVFEWARYLWERDSGYRSALEKAVTYFVSDVKVEQDDRDSTPDAEEVAEFKDLLTDTYGMLPLIVDFGKELAAMGNVFVSAERIFSRWLLCPEPGCSWQMALKGLHRGRDYEWDGAHFTGRCPRCGRQVTWKVRDEKSQDSDGRLIRFVFRPAEDMRIDHNCLTGTSRYCYCMPDHIAEGIRRGDPAYLEDTPKVFMDAAVLGEKYIEFPEDSFFAARTGTLASMDRLLQGWGLPLMMRAFDNLMALQQLAKYNEAVISDYLIPTRIVSPMPQNLRAGIDDPNRMPMSGSAFRGFMSAALRGRASNPTQWIVSPVPVQQQQIGGDKDIIPYELCQWQKQQTMADMKIAAEFSQSDLQTVAPTMGLRMYERSWVDFVHLLNRGTAWLGDAVARAHGFQDMVCSLDTTSFVEDDMRRQTVMGLMQAGLVAKAPVLSGIGIDFDEDLKQRIKEQQAEEKAYAEQQAGAEGSEMLQSVLPPAAAPGMGQAQMNIQAMQQQAQGAMPQDPSMAGMPPQGAMPVPGETPMPFNTSASGSASVEQMFQDAQNMAQQLMQVPPAERRRQLVQLKTQNPSLHAAVKQMLSDMRQQVASDAVAQAQGMM